MIVENVRLLRNCQVHYDCHGLPVTEPVALPGGDFQREKWKQNPAVVEIEPLPKRTTPSLPRFVLDLGPIFVEKPDPDQQQQQCTQTTLMPFYTSHAFLHLSCFSTTIMLPYIYHATKNHNTLTHLLRLSTIVITLDY